MEKKLWLSTAAAAVGVGLLIAATATAAPSKTAKPAAWNDRCGDELGRRLHRPAADLLPALVGDAVRDGVQAVQLPGQGGATRRSGAAGGVGRNADRLQGREDVYLHDPLRIPVLERPAGDRRQLQDGGRPPVAAEARLVHVLYRLGPDRRHAECPRRQGLVGLGRDREGQQAHDQADYIPDRTCFRGWRRHPSRRSRPRWRRTPIRRARTPTPPAARTTTRPARRTGRSRSSGIRTTRVPARTTWTRSR